MSNFFNCEIKNFWQIRQKILIYMIKKKFDVYIRQRKFGRVKGSLLLEW